MSLRLLRMTLGAFFVAGFAAAQAPAAKPTPSPAASPTQAATPAPILPYEEPPPPPHPKISLSDFIKDHQLHNVVVLDVRSFESYKEGHIPGSVSLPLSDLEDRADEVLKKTKRPIVAYCT